MATARVFVIIVSATGLASCYAVTETDVLKPAARQQDWSRVTIGATGSPLSTPTVTNARSVVAYHDDLQRCRGKTALVLSPARETDDVAALRRELSQTTPGATFTLHQKKGDLAFDRDVKVKSCLTRLGYSFER